MLYKVAGKGQRTLHVGAHSLLHCKIYYDKAGATVRIGERSFIGKSKLISACNITIGSDVLISWGVTITDHNSHSVHYVERSGDVLDWAQGKKDWSNVAQRSVSIGDKVWVGFNASILKGVTIGEGAVIAAGSIVTKDVLPWTICGGNPAKLIRELGRNERG